MEKWNKDLYYDEIQRELYVELPLLIHSILLKEIIRLGSKEDAINIAEIIKKISSEEISSTLDIINKF